MKATNKKGSGNILRCFHSLQFCPTNRDNSPVWALFCFIGYDCEPFVCVTQGEIATSAIVFANYDINPYFIMAFPYASQI